MSSFQQNDLGEKGLRERSSGQCFEEKTDKKRRVYVAGKRRRERRRIQKNNLSLFLNLK